MPSGTAMDDRPQRKGLSGIKAALDQSASWAANLARTATDTIRKEYKFTFEDLSTTLVPVRPNLLACEFPRRNVMHWLALRLNRDHAGNYLVVNLSGQTYDTYELQGPVMDVVLAGHSPAPCVPPVDVLLRLCVSIHKWLSSSDSHVLAAHGPDTREYGVGALGPVVLLFACYLSWAGLVPHPLDGLLEVCAALNIADAAVWPSFRRYLSYFELLQRGNIQTAGTPLVRLARLGLIQVGGDGVFRELQVWQQDRMLFTAFLNLDNPSEGEGSGSTVLKMAVPCRGDVQVRILRAAELASAESLPVLELQVCFHTAFITAVGSFARFPLRELDVPASARNGAMLPPECAVDVFLEPATEQDEEPEDPLREAAAAAAAAVAATAAAAAGKREEPSAQGTAGQPKEGPKCYSMASADDAEGDDRRSRLVFAPEDVDSFFDEL